MFDWDDVPEELGGPNKATQKIEEAAEADSAAEAAARAAAAAREEARLAAMAKARAMADAGVGRGRGLLGLRRPEEGSDGTAVDPRLALAERLGERPTFDPAALAHRDEVARRKFEALQEQIHEGMAAQDDAWRGFARKPKFISYGAPCACALDLCRCKEDDAGTPSPPPSLLMASSPQQEREKHRLVGYE